MGGKYLIEGYIVDGETIIRESTGEAIPDKPFSVLHLSTRPSNVLMREKDRICRTPKEKVHLTDLLCMSEEDLLRLRNLGVGSAREIMNELGKYLRDPEEYSKNNSPVIPADHPSAENREYEVTDAGIHVLQTGEILPDVPMEEIDLKQHWKKLLMNHGLLRTSQIYGMSLNEFAAKIQFGRPVAENLRGKVAEALRQYLQVKELVRQQADEEKKISEMSFSQFAENSDKLKEQQRQVLQCRMAGETLQGVADRLNCTRERIRQIEKAAFNLLTNKDKRRFKEDQFAYLYQTYLVPEDFFQNFLKQNREAWYYLSTRYNHGKLPLGDALEDEKLSPETRIAVSEYLQKDTVIADGERVVLSRNDIEEYLIVNFCQEDTTLEQFAALYDRFIVEHNLQDSSLAGSDVYVSGSRINRFIYAANALWKQNQRMRYYDTSKDMTELLTTLNLGQYHNVEISARKFIMEYPELMRKYDIRDEYELHNLLKKIHAETYNKELVFERMPFLLFGSFDRDRAVKELIYAYSPLTGDELARLISRRYGASINTIKSNWLKAAAVYYHHGMYVRPVEDDPDRTDASHPLPESSRTENTESGSAAAGDRKTSGRKVLTPREKLFRRIRREFGKKKLIGDIAISDEEFEILMSYFRSQCRYLLTQCELFECDEILCVALVQIGIRYYDDGKYWPFVREILNAPQYKDSHFNWLGSSFQSFLQRNGKLVIPGKKNLSNILMHGFVSDKRANEFFDFLLMFYDIDLRRDIHLLKTDKSLMSGLMENIKSTGTQGRTYKLLEHTADAIRCNEKGGRIRLNRYLKMIDRAFWDPEDLPKQSGNRLTGYFLEWSSRSKTLEEKRKGRKRSILKKKRRMESVSEIYVQQG